jgi:translocation and assembly module TamA
VNRSACLLSCVLLAGLVVSARAAKAPRVLLTGVGDRSLIELLRSVSACCAGGPAQTPEILEQRMVSDRQAMTDALCGRGYFSNQIAVKMEKEPKAKITFQVETGPLFRFRKVEVSQDPASATTPVALPGARELGLEPGQPALSRSVVSAQGALESWLSAHGRPVSNRIERAVLVSKETQTVDVLYQVRPGPLVHLGATHFRGVAAVNEAFLRAFIPWKMGALYDPSLLVKYQQVLMGKNLFTVVLVTLERSRAKEKVKDGVLVLPVRVEVRERRHHTNRAGVSYRTDSGLGGELGWTHRNVRGVGQQADVQAVASGIVQAVSAKYVVPQFLHPEQSLLLTARLGRDTPVSFTSKNFSTAATVERALSARLRISGGFALKFSDVSQNFLETHQSLIQTPLSLTFDSSDGLLDPTCGQRLSFNAVPNLNMANTNVCFATISLKHRSYHSLSRNKRTVLATRLAGGVIAARDRTIIPGDERFYSGGGGSVRGYPFQSIGIARGPTVLGGQSFAEGSLELRRKVTPVLGFVGFLDAGTVMDTALGVPQQVLVGAGVGGRYYSPVGPIRLDVAVPLDRRPGIDAPFQVYASLGQAF